MTMEKHTMSDHDSENSPAVDTAQDEFTSRKRAEILEACRWNMIGALESLAETQGGFLDDEVRRQAWPILLGVSNGETSSSDEPDGGSWKELPRHKDEDQVQLDVNRAFIYYPCGMFSYRPGAASASHSNPLQTRPMRNSPNGNPNSPTSSSPSSVDTHTYAISRDTTTSARSFSSSSQRRSSEPASLLASPCCASATSCSQISSPPSPSFA